MTTYEIEKKSFLRAVRALVRITGNPSNETYPALQQVKIVGLRGGVVLQATDRYRLGFQHADVRTHTDAVGLKIALHAKDLHRALMFAPKSERFVKLEVEDEKVKVDLGSIDVRLPLYTGTDIPKNLTRLVPERPVDGRFNPEYLRSSLSDFEGNGPVAVSFDPDKRKPAAVFGEDAINVVVPMHPSYGGSVSDSPDARPFWWDEFVAADGAA